MKKHSAEQIQATADAIMSHFIPKNTTDAFSFHFTIPPASNYKATYQKDNKGNWLFSTYEVDEK